MKTIIRHSEDNLPVLVETACGARIKQLSNAPQITYQGETVYFCGWDCKQLYEEDPLSSCLASRLLSGK